jgi:hypothetical protein
MIKRLIAASVLALGVSAGLVLSACSVRPPAAHEISEVTYKGHAYVISKTTHGYSVMAHAGHCPATHN